MCPVQAGRSGGHSPQTAAVPRDSALVEFMRWLETLALKLELPILTDGAITLYGVPPSGSISLRNTGIPLDEVEDLLLESAAYRQASRILLPKARDVDGRPLTPGYTWRSTVGNRGRIQFINMLNHTNFAPPALNISNSITFGVLTAPLPRGLGEIRTGQLAVRLDFESGV